MEQSCRVVFDTNMLLNIERFKVDVFEETRKLLGRVEFEVPKQVIEELKKLAERNAKLRKEVNVAMELMEKRNVTVIEVEAENADKALLKLASEAIIATNDKELKDSVRELNGRVLYLRQRKFAELSWGVMMNVH